MSERDVGLTEPANILEALPEVVEHAVVPRLFGPSTFASLMQCPLKVIHGLSEEEMLPPSPVAILGDVIHEVMNETRADRLLHERSTTEYVDELFDLKIRLEEERLSEDPRTKRLVPLRRAVGKTEYQNRMARLRTWAKMLSGGDQSRPFETSAQGSVVHCGPEDEPADTSRIPVGAEQPVRVSSLRLSGRPDLIEIDEDGTYHVTDFKTGNILDRAGQPKEDYTLQVRLYALMLQEIDESARVRLWLEGGTRVEVPWDEGHSEETMEQVLSIREKLPVGRTLSAAKLAKAGPHCGSCRIRHRCRRYRDEAPIWWVRKSSEYAVAPFDIWGDVLEVVAEGEETAEVMLHDAAGRSARVSGIDAEGVRPGDRVWFFDLQPTQILPHQGIFVHPQNFHAKRPNRVWKDAVRFYGFVESRAGAALALEETLR